MKYLYPVVLSLDTSLLKFTWDGTADQTLARGWVSPGDRDADQSITVPEEESKLLC